MHDAHDDATHGTWNLRLTLRVGHCLLLDATGLDAERAMHCRMQTWQDRRPPGWPAAWQQAAVTAPDVDPGNAFAINFKYSYTTVCLESDCIAE